MGMLGRLGAPMPRLMQDITASPALNVPQAPEPTQQEIVAQALRLGIIPNADPVDDVKSTLLEYPKAIRPYLAAGMLPAVGVTRMVSGLPDVLASAVTAPKRAFTGELQMNAQDPNTGEAHTSPEALGEAWNVAMTAPLGGLAAAPLEEAVGMGRPTKMGPGKISGLNQSLEARAKQMELPPAQRIQPDSAPLPVEEYKRAAKPATEDLSGMYPRAESHDDYPMGGRAIPLIEHKDEIASGLASRMEPELGKPTQFFYHTDPIREGIESLGFSKEHAQKWMDDFADAYAAFSPRTDTAQNIRNATLAMAKKEAGVPLTDIVGSGTGGISEKGYPMMIGPGGIHKSLWEDVSGTGINRDKNPKPWFFSKNVAGNRTGVTADTHAIRAALDVMNEKYPGTIIKWIKPEFRQAYLADPTQLNPATWIDDTLGSISRKGKISQVEYAPVADIYHGAAEKLGVEPAESQSMGWFGSGPRTGLKSDRKTIADLLSERINVTAKGMGETEPATAKRLFKREISLLANPKEAAPLLAIMRGRKPVMAGAEAEAKVAEEAKLAPVFHSAVEKAVEGAPQSRASGPQWLGMLKNVPGVKPEELEWLKLDKFLSKGTVPDHADLMARLSKGESNPTVPSMFTKQEVLDHIRANRLEIPVELLGKKPAEKRAAAPRVKKDKSPATPDEIEQLKKRLGDYGWRDIESDLADAYKEGDVTDVNRRHPMASNLIDRILARPETTTEAMRTEAFAEAAQLLREHPHITVEERGMALAGNESRQGSGPIKTQYEKWSEPGGKDYRELLFKLPRQEETVHGQTGDFQARTRAYSAPHFGSRSSNLLAHVRFKDRVDVHGKKTLAIEEIQSDWHQQGRDRGYDHPATQAEKSELESYYRVIQRGGRVPDSAIPRYNELRRIVERGDGVPDAPFKKTWPELVMKRMIRWASEHGYDQIAWMPGEVHNARYNLSKHVDRLVWGQGDKLLQAFKNGQMVIEKSATAEELPGLIGKEAAEKLLNAPTGKHFLPAFRIPEAGGVFPGDTKHAVHTLSGMDLDIGGSGMKGFYDKMLPNIASKISKEKVGVTRMADGDGYTVKKNRYGRWDVYSGRKKLESWSNEEQARASAAMAKGTGQEMWVLPITSKLKEKALKEGFPLFSNAPVAGMGSFIPRGDQSASP